ncbi:hypothetical protein EYF80_023572 [Liparis tanakae]|uniref:Uncharacterized protein n=1 Tax=Liparis tanakae TaxID=230148 RepID=A0A4Z2HMM8_9TELE|nr:hypothetical protein EYF80_023572 [Liparis tanakae]
MSTGMTVSISSAPLDRITSALLPAMPSVKQYGLFPPVRFVSSSLFKLFAFYLCHANQDSHSSMNFCVQKTGQGSGSRELRGTARLPLSPLVLPPLIYEESLFPPAKFAKSNFQLIWRSQPQAQRA